MLLQAKPEPLTVDVYKSALVVVDMQNGFASKGGMLDLAGADIADAPRLVESIAALLQTARSAGMAVVYLQMGYKADLSDGGGPDSPNPRKELALRLMCSRPELKARGIRYLFFTGIAANVCVESTLRDAFFLDYWPILIADATMAAGPAFMREATLFNVESFFGWTVEAREFTVKLAPG